VIGRPAKDDASQSGLRGSREGGEAVISEPLQVNRFQKLDGLLILILKAI
jgi:hypothetical protein